jgi:hypothetical protein
MRNSSLLALLFFVAYGIFIEFGPKPAQTKTQSMWQNNQLQIEEFFRAEKTPEVVIIGSSLAERLDFKRDSSCIYNMALGGDSALTGLSALARSERIPRKVFIEINVPERGINKDLIDKATGVLPKLSSIFYIENMPINLLYSFLFFRLQTKKSNIAPEANEAVRQNALSVQRQSYSQTLTSETLAKNLAEFRAIVSTLESKGAKIIFFEMPVHPDLENTPRAVQIRTDFKHAFPINKFIGFDELSNGLTIKTGDGLHLIPDEAKNVVLIFKGYFKGACNT